MGQKAIYEVDAEGSELAIHHFLFKIANSIVQIEFWSEPANFWSRTV